MYTTRIGLELQLSVADCLLIGCSKNHHPIRSQSKHAAPLVRCICVMVQWNMGRMQLWMLIGPFRVAIIKSESFQTDDYGNFKLLDTDFQILDHVKIL